MKPPASPVVSLAGRALRARRRAHPARERPAGGGRRQRARPRHRDLARGRGHGPDGDRRLPRDGEHLAAIEPRERPPLRARRASITTPRPCGSPLGRPARGPTTSRPRRPERAPLCRRRRAGRRHGRPISTPPEPSGASSRASRRRARVRRARRRDGGRLPRRAARRAARRSGSFPGADRARPTAFVDVAIPDRARRGAQRARRAQRRCALAVGRGYGTLSEIAFALKARKPVVGARELGDRGRPSSGVARAGGLGGARRAHLDSARS